MPNPWKFFLIHGYGCNIDSPLKPYLDRMGMWISQEQPGAIILCGGYTQRKSFPGRSEAEVMHTYLQTRQLNRIYPYKPQVVIEDDSYTTLENIQKTCAIIRATPDIDKNWDRVTVTVGCEAQRALKSEILYRKLMPELMAGPKRLIIETHSWERANPIGEITKISFDLLALRVPRLARWQRERMIRKSETR